MRSAAQCLKDAAIPAHCIVRLGCGDAWHGRNALEQHDARNTGAVADLPVRAPVYSDTAGDTVLLVDVL